MQAPAHPDRLTHKCEREAGELQGIPKQFVPNCSPRPIGGVATTFTSKACALTVRDTVRTSPVIVATVIKGGSSVLFGSIRCRPFFVSISSRFRDW